MESRSGKENEFTHTSEESQPSVCNQLDTRILTILSHITYNWFCVFIFFLLICFVKCMRGSTCRWCGGVRTPFRPMKNSYFLNLHSKASTKNMLRTMEQFSLSAHDVLYLIHRCAIVLDLKVHSL